MPRYKCKSIAALDIALSGLPAKMRVEADAGIGVSAKTVGELRKVTTWSENLVITKPQEHTSSLSRSFRKTFARSELNVWRFQRIQNISGLSKDEHRPWVIQCLMMLTGNVENTCCAVCSLVDISSAVWAARRWRGLSPCRRGSAPYQTRSPNV